MRIITDDQVFPSFKGIRGIFQYVHITILDVLAKVRQYNVYIFFVNWSAAGFERSYIIQVIARQYGEELSNEQISAMDLDTKCYQLKRNPVSVAHQIDCALKNLWGKWNAANLPNTKS